MNEMMVPLFLLSVALSILLFFVVLELLKTNAFGELTETRKDLYQPLGCNWRVPNTFQLHILVPVPLIPNHRPHN